MATEAQKIRKEANELARRFYRILGYTVNEGYRFDQATHPQEVDMWQMAKIAFEHLRATDLDEIADEAIEDDAEEGSDNA